MIDNDARNFIENEYADKGYYLQSFIGKCEKKLDALLDSTWFRKAICVCYIVTMWNKKIKMKPKRKLYWHNT